MVEIGAAMQQRLNQIYGTFIGTSARRPQVASRLVCPLFVSVGPAWECAARRLLVVGQETLSEWKFAPAAGYPWPHPPLSSLAACQQYPAAVEALVEFYRWCIHETKSWSKGTPFWDAVRELVHFTNAQMLWTNLCRCTLQDATVVGAYDSGSLTQAQFRDFVDWQRGLLAQEVAVLQPTTVVFFTGPTYDQILLEEFSDVQFQAIGDNPIRALARLSAHGLPFSSFRGYHPNYLRRSKQWDHVATIASAITSVS